MTFTDDDLKRLKQEIGEDIETESIYQMRMPHIIALVSRLEAAEKALNGSTHIEVDYPESKCEGCKNMEAWRKSKGETA